MNACTAFTVGLVWMLVAPAIEGFVPTAMTTGVDENARVVDDSADAKRVDADDESNAQKYASMKRVPIRGAMDPEIIARARTLLTLKMGEERVILVNDKPYAFRLELHYHPPGFANGPNGWHKGVTVYELRDQEPEAARARTIDGV